MATQLLDTRVKAKLLLAMVSKAKVDMLTKPRGMGEEPPATTINMAATALPISPLVAFTGKDKELAILAMVAKTTARQSIMVVDSEASPAMAVAAVTAEAMAAATAVATAVAKAVAKAVAMAEAMAALATMATATVMATVMATAAMVPNLTAMLRPTVTATMLATLAMAVPPTTVATVATAETDTATTMATGERDESI